MGPQSASEPLRILIVEDEFILALELQMIVQNAGHEVVGMAKTAEAAIAGAERWRPDVALMDLRLADGSLGREAARVILERHGIRSVFLSGNLDAATRRHLAELEPIAMMTKPIDRSELEDVLKAVAASPPSAPPEA